MVRSAVAVDQHLLAGADRVAVAGTVYDGGAGGCDRSSLGALDRRWRRRAAARAPSGAAPSAAPSAPAGAGARAAPGASATARAPGAGATAGGGAARRDGRDRIARQHRRPGRTDQRNRQPIGGGDLTVRDDEIQPGIRPEVGKARRRVPIERRSDHQAAADIQVRILRQQINARDQRHSRDDRVVVHVPQVKEPSAHCRIPILQGHAVASAGQRNEEGLRAWGERYLVDLRQRNLRRGRLPRIAGQ